MIEKMKKVTIFAPADRRVQTIKALRRCGVVHIADLVQKSESSIGVEKVRDEYESSLSAILEKKDKKHPVEQKALTDEEFEVFNRNTQNVMNEKKSMAERLTRLRLERDRIAPYGAFRPEDVRDLAGKGIALHFYNIGEKDLSRLRAEKDQTVLVLRDGKQCLIATVGAEVAKGFGTTEVVLPEKGLEDIEAEIVSIEKRLLEIEDVFTSYLPFENAWKERIRKKEGEILFERAKSSVKGDEELIHLTGWVPVKSEEKVKAAAAKNGWGWMLTDPRDDENPPTLVTYKGPVRIVKPVFDILGTVPGYREMDISSYFLLFFTLFFAMIIGDAGYGLILLIAAIVMNVMRKKADDTNILLYVVGIATVVWGALTGTWFGSEKVLTALPFLQKLIIPSITNFPELMGVDAGHAQNMVMKFSFIIGAVQLSLACVINVFRKIPEKDLSWVADVGWLIDVLVLYFLVLNLVIGESCSIAMVAIGVGIGFALVCIFGAQGPGDRKSVV